MENYKRKITFLAQLKENKKHSLFYVDEKVYFVCKWENQKLKFINKKKVSLIVNKRSLFDKQWQKWDPNISTDTMKQKAKT